MDAASRCLCPDCPAYPEADRGVKKAYCLGGDSPHKADIDPADCLCETCEVYKRGQLYGRNFYCLEGKALAEGLRRIREWSAHSSTPATMDRRSNEPGKPGADAS